MQDFRWRFDYSAIFMVWCVGYLDRHNLIAFLKRAKAQLAKDTERVSRNTPPKAFIFVLDNVLEPGEEPVIIKGQLVRSEG